MIVKERIDGEHADGGKLAEAGAAAERQMAFYLRRAFAAEPSVLVANDLRIPDGGNDYAQVDHLLVHRYGLIVVESKSVHDSIVVNEQGEWWRTFKGQRAGMPSPVLQARRQADVVRRVLAAKFDPAGSGGGFARVPFAVLVAVSDDGIIERGSDVPEVCKADTVPDRVRALIEAGRAGPKLFDGPARQRVADHLVALHLPRRRAPATAAAPPAKVALQPVPSDPKRPTCRHCGSSALHAQHGKFGYFFCCIACTQNTAIAKGCPACGSPNAKVRKAKLNFFKDCATCGKSTLIYTNASLDDLDGPEDD